MPSEWIFPIVAVPFYLIVIPLLFIAVTLMSRLRKAWTARVIWRGVRCPTKKTAVRVGFLEKVDSLRNLKKVDTIYCTAFSDPSRVTCGKECLRDCV